LLAVTTACSGGKSDKGNHADPTGAGPTTTTSAPPTPQAVAAEFLAAWQAGDWTKAASYTDLADKAGARLQSVMTSLGSPKVTLTLGDPTAPASPAATSSASASGSAAPSGGATPGAASSASASPSAVSLGGFAFSVVDDFGNNLQWPYKSLLTMVQGPDGTPLVHWSSSVIHPSLSASATLKAVPPKQSVTDKGGAPLSSGAHPTLAAAITALSTKLPAGTTPTALTIEFTDLNTGSQIKDSQSFPIGAADPAAMSLKTTIDDSVQSKLEAALKQYPESAMVAIQPSTGYILGMAANSTSFSSLAYKGARAPGSTFKVITTALALQEGLKITDTVKCTPNVVVEGQPITNDSDLANGLPAGTTLQQAFLASCNTAFVNLAMDGRLGGDYGALANEAKTYFGMNQKWDLGMGPATYGTQGDQQVPAATGKGDFAREAFGQAGIEMSALTMASVAATVCSGSFHQPVLVPGTQTISATPLPAGVAAQLTTLMQGVATSGTAAGVFHGLPGIAAKTGSAEHQGQKKTDSWMIVFDKQHDIAVGAFVQAGGFGRDAAGPAINTFLNSLY
jgi:hypothetical protein